MGEESIKRSTFVNVLWKFAERISAQGVTLLVSIVLARILMPEDYGAVAILTVFINVCNILVSKSFGNALIRKKDADNIDFSTAFYINLAMTFVMYIILFISAPFIANFYNAPILCALLRVMGLRIPCTAINSIQNAYVSRHLMFKKFFWATLFGTILSAIVGITLAILDFGAWALVGQYLTNTFIDTVFLWFTVKWRPEMVFSFSRAKSLFSYGWKLLASSLLEEINIELKTFVIGKQYSAADLAYYNKGKQFPQIINTNVGEAVSSVLFPVYAKAQDDERKLKHYVKDSLKTLSFVIFPLQIGLIGIADSFVFVLLTEKWLPSVIYLQILCATFLFTPMNTINGQILKAKGYSGYYLAISIVNNLIGIIMLLFSMSYGVLGIALGGFVSTAIGSVIISLPNKKLIGYGYLDQMKDVFPNLLLSLVLLFVVQAMKNINMPILLLIVLQIVVGMVVYILGAFFLKYESLQYLVNIIKEHFSNHRRG